MKQLDSRTEPIGIRTRLGLLACCLMLLTSACRSGENPATETDVSQAPAPDASHEAVSSSRSLLFVTQEDGAIQYLQVIETSDTQIEFMLSLDSSCTRTEMGTAAISPEEGDLEIELGPDGDGYPVDEYYFGGADNCLIAISLALGERPYAWLRESECSVECAFSEEPMLRK